MKSNCPVATFIRDQIERSKKTQKEIAELAGFDKPNMISMLKKGDTKLPLAKVGSMAEALDTDPVHLLKLCLSTYQPETWESIAQYFETAITHDEAMMLQTLRDTAAVPAITALTQESRVLWGQFLESLRRQQVQLN